MRSPGLHEHAGSRVAVCCAPRSTRPSGRRAMTPTPTRTACAVNDVRVAVAVAAAVAAEPYGAARPSQRRSNARRATVSSSSSSRARASKACERSGQLTSRQRTYLPTHTRESMSWLLLVLVGFLAQHIQFVVLSINNVLSRPPRPPLTTHH
eukprot:446125-Pleurochrysis_carterae.AAC.1